MVLFTRTIMIIKRRNKMQIMATLEVLRNEIMKGKSNAEIYIFFRKDQPTLKYKTFESWIRMIYEQDLERAQQRVDTGFAHSVMKCSDQIEAIKKLCNEIINDPDSSQQDRLGAAKLLKDCTIDGVKVEAYLPTAVSRTNLQLYNGPNIRGQVLQPVSAEGTEEIKPEP